MPTSKTNKTVSRDTVVKKKALTVKNVLGPNQDFNERLVDVIPFIDPDSTRFIEWIWAVRNKANKSTHACDYSLPSNLEVPLDELVEIVEGKFENVYHSSHYFRGIRLDKNGVPDFIVVIGNTGNSSMVVVAGEKKEVKETIDIYKEKYTPPKVININQLTGFSGDGSALVKENQLQEDEVTLAHDAFYPWIEEGIDAYVERFRKAKSNVILLIGPPGTGKSSFLRTMLFKLNPKHIHLVYNEQTLMNPAFVHWLEGLPRHSAVAIEDADTFVSKREEQNYQMSALLNYVEGVIPNNSKVIISTNLGSLSKVEPALLRVGRNFDIIEFKELSIDQAHKARKAIGLPKIKFFEEHKELTLSNALNYETVNRDKFSKHQKPKFGMNQS